MKPKWQKLASLAQLICPLWFQFFSAVFASKGYPFKNTFDVTCTHWERGLHLRSFGEKVFASNYLVPLSLKFVELGSTTLYVL